MPRLSKTHLILIASGLGVLLLGVALAIAFRSASSPPVDLTGLSPQGLDLEMFDGSLEMLKRHSSPVRNDAGNDYVSLWEAARKELDEPAWTKLLGRDVMASDVFDAYIEPGEPTELGFSSPAPSREKLTEAMRAAQSAHAKLLASLRALTPRPAHLPMKWDTLDDLIGFNAPPVIAVVKFVTAIARLQLEEGQADEALLTLNDGLTIAERLQQSRALIPVLVANATEKLVQEQLRVAVRDHRLNMEQLRRADAMLMRVDAARPPVSDTWRAEYITFVRSVEEVQKDKDVNATKKAFGINLAGNLLIAEMATGSRIYRRVIESVDLPLAQAQAELDAVQKDLDAISAQNKSAGYSPGILLTIVFPNLASINSHRGRIVAGSRGTRVSIAIEMLRLTSGEANPPARLPGGVNVVDPFSGQPLRYQPSGQHYRLWSVGPDGKDDGGKSAGDDPPDDVLWPPGG